MSDMTWNRKQISQIVTINLIKSELKCKNETFWNYRWAFFVSTFEWQTFACLPDFLVYYILICRAFVLNISPETMFEYCVQWALQRKKKTIIKYQIGLTTGSTQWCRFSNITIIRIMRNIIFNNFSFVWNYIGNCFDDNITVWCVRIAVSLAMRWFCFTLGCHIDILIFTVIIFSIYFIALLRTSAFTVIHHWCIFRHFAIQKTISISECHQ